MDIYLIRHAEAVAPGEGGTDGDFARPLTAAGMEQARRLAMRFLERGIRIERVWHSPLVRCQQTAAILVEAWKLASDQVAECPELAPEGRRKKLARRIGGQPVASMALIGHRPDLNLLAAWLVGHPKARIRLDKAGVALIQTDSDDLHKGCGELVWLASLDWL